MTWDWECMENSNKKTKTKQNQNKPNQTIKPNQEEKSCQGIKSFPWAVELFSEFEQKHTILGLNHNRFPFENSTNFAYWYFSMDLKANS